MLIPIFSILSREQGHHRSEHFTRILFFAACIEKARQHHDTLGRRIASVSIIFFELLDAFVHPIGIGRLGIV